MNYGIVDFSIVVKVGDPTLQSTLLEAKLSAAIAMRESTRITSI